MHPHLVVLGIRCETNLRRIAARLQQLGIQFRPFYEPDLGEQLTALATNPLSDSQRRPLRRYQCWKPDETKTTHEDKNMSTVNKQNRSEYGFHACDREFFGKLKYLHKRYWETLRRFHQWNRWNNKEPQNRIGPQPKYCDAFVTEDTWRKPVTRHGEQHFKWYPKTVIDHAVIELYQAARIPAADPVPPLSADCVARIEQLFTTVREYFNE